MELGEPETGLSYDMTSTELHTNLMRQVKRDAKTTTRSPVFVAFPGKSHIKYTPPFQDGSEADPGPSVYVEKVHHLKYL